MPTEYTHDVGPCIKCGHPPRCHPERQCDANMYSTPCNEYVPDPEHAIKLPGRQEDTP
jgi:hypothetical protein